MRQSSGLWGVAPLEDDLAGDRLADPAADRSSRGITRYGPPSRGSFGRILPRPNKWVAKLQEAVDSVPLARSDDGREQVARRSA